MRNILTSVLLGALVAAALFVPGLLRLGEAVVPGVLVLLLAYYLLARRTFKRVEAIFTEAAAHLGQVPPKLDRAVATLEKAYAYGPVQIGVKSQVDGQIGMIYFLQKDFNRALPYLERTLTFGHWMGGAMLGVLHYKKKNLDAMHKTFDVVLRRGKKQSLAWTLYAYLLQQSGEREKAQAVLTRGLAATKHDPRVQEALLAVQNDRKIKMRAYKEQWYQFHLERPPAQYQTVPVGGRVSKAARRGRWS